MKAHTTCPIAHCNRKRGVDKLLCFHHWNQVPRALQRRLYAAWNNGTPFDSYIAIRAEVLALFTAHVLERTQEEAAADARETAPTTRELLERSIE